MQYKNNIKISIDKRKLEILLRVGCPENVIWETIKTGKITKTGDKLIDDNLETFMDIKEFNNWGGNHNPKGINQYKQKKNLGQVVHHLDGQVVQQDAGQVADKDIDIDIDKNNINNYIKDFELFWNLYTPIKSNDGRFVAKGSKSACQQKYIKLLQKGVKNETIINGLKQYLTYCRENGYCSCGAEVFLNQRRFENDYTGNGTVQSRVATGSNGKGVSIVDIAREFIAETENRN